MIKPDQACRAAMDGTASSFHSVRSQKALDNKRGSVLSLVTPLQGTLQAQEMGQATSG